MEPFEIVWFVLEVVLEVVGDALWDIGSLDPSTRDALFATFLCFATGAAVGLGSGLVLPDRLLPKPRTAGLSLVASPLLSGVAMHAWGTLRRERGHALSPLATFHGGAAFALGAALGRFVLVA
jgi:hypothetical protein